MHYLLLPLSILLFSGCTSLSPYEPAALPDSQTAIANALAAQPSGEGEFRLSEAARLLDTYNAELRGLRAAFANATGLASIASPRPNPELEVSGAYGSRMPEDGREAASGIGVAFAFPLGPRLQRADDLNAAKAASAEVDLQARTRELYMQLRAAYAEVSLRRNQVGEKAALVGSAAESAELAIKLAEIGTATRLDVNLLELEFQERRLAVADAESAVVEAETALATLLGVPHSTLAGRALQALRFEGQWPALVELRSLLVENHADLARLRADFAEADAALRLELARQIPDLELGAAFEQEVGEQTDLIGIGIGIELPVFDRNQQEIAAARGEREAVRVRYESTLSAALADLDGALVRYRLLSERRAMLEQDLLPRAKSALADAEKLLAAGAIEALRLLELQRGERQALLELMEAEAERVRAMLAIESAIGRPFFLLPGERLPEVK